MNIQKSSIMPYVIIAIVVAVAVAVYFYWNGTKPAESGSFETVNASEQVVGARVFQLLSEIKSLKIDSALFNDPAYKSLKDYSVEIPSLPIGRPNPFAPLPGVLAPGVTVTTSGASAGSTNR